MHRAVRASWEIGVDQPQHLLIGLFIRDVAGVPSRHSWLPPASPAVLRAGEQASMVAGRQWDAWWDQAVREASRAEAAGWPPDLSSWWTPPEFESLNAAPELRVIVAAHFFDAVRWSGDRHREHGATMQSRDRGLVESTIVKKMEHDLRRKAQPFHLWVTEIPVDGQHFWQMGPGQVLVSADLLRDTDQYRERLTPVVEALF